MESAEDHTKRMLEENFNHITEECEVCRDRNEILVYGQKISNIKKKTSTPLIKRERQYPDNFKLNGFECVECGEELTGAARKYCSGQCNRDHYKKIYEMRKL